MTPCWNNREVRSLFFYYIFYVTLIMMMMMFNAQCTKHSCTCPIFFVHSPDQSTFTTGPPHPAWKTLCPYGVGKIYVLKGTNMFLDSFQRNTIQFRGNSYLFRNFSWQAPIFKGLSQRVATLSPQNPIIQLKIREYICATSISLCRKSKKQMFGQHQI